MEILNEVNKWREAVKKCNDIFEYLESKEDDVNFLQEYLQESMIVKLISADEITIDDKISINLVDVDKVYILVDDNFRTTY